VSLGVVSLGMVLHPVEVREAKRTRRVCPHLWGPGVPIQGKRLQFEKHALMEGLVGTMSDD
jgi:hypothetical protein